MLRGSGIQWDIRKAMPYEAYDEMEFDVPVFRQLRHLRSLPGADGGDAAVGPNHQHSVWRSCRKGPSWPSGPGCSKGPKDSDVYFSVEGPKGEIGFYIVGDGSPNPYRCRVRPPSLYNIEVLPEMVTGWSDRRSDRGDRYHRHRPGRGGSLMSGLLAAVHDSLGETFFYYVLSPR